MVVHIVGWQTDPRYRDVLLRVLRTQALPLYARSGCQASYVLHDESYRYWRIVSTWESEGAVGSFRATPGYRSLGESLRDFYAGPHEDRVYATLSE